MDDPTSVQVYVPRVLRDGCGGAAYVSLEAATIRDLLQALERAYPKVYVGICDETGRVRRHINVFVNTSHMLDCDGLETVLQSGDTVTLLPAVSGG
jgi:MoaD family protein